VTRPAETAGAGGTVALLAAYTLGIHDPQTIVLLGAVFGLVPALVTLLVANGGLRGVVGLLWRGRSRS
jgi:sorbitol-specific phosphotransferase system component IIC